MSKQSVLLEAVQAAKDSQFGATAIKVELEANLRRSYARTPENEAACDICNDSGSVQCSECNGECSYYQECENCEGSGWELDSDGERTDDECGDCNGSGELYDTCNHCDGDGEFDCDSCDEEGREERRANAVAPWSSEKRCLEFLLDKMVGIGLAERTDDLHSIGDKSVYFALKAPLKYMKFYNDGSVDSECTFTIMLDDTRNVLYLPKVVKAFKELADAVGEGCDVAGAGMHMAFLNRTSGGYPQETASGNGGDIHAGFSNFKKAVEPLLPALFFLSTCDDSSRPLRFRQPKIESAYQSYDAKYSAVTFRYNALEFRVFNTCYQQPEAILDNVVVMSNCLQFWNENYQKTGLEGVVREFSFGNDVNDKLDRFYVETPHMEMLDRGLEVIKPSYYTVAKLKEQRNFDTSADFIKKREEKEIESAKAAYLEYVDRSKWLRKSREHRFLYEYLDRQASTPNPRQTDLQVMRAANKYAKKQLEQMAPVDPEDKYIARSIEQYRRKLRGQYVISVPTE